MDLSGRSLRCMVVRLGGQHEMVFLVSIEEEKRVLAVLQERPRPFEIILSTALYSESVERDTQELKRLLDGTSALVIGAVQKSQGVDVDRMAELVSEAHLRGLPLRSLESALLDLDPSVPAQSGELIHRLLVSGTYQSRMIRAYAAIKDLFEPALAAIMLLLLSPLVILTALAVKLTSPGPVFYRQTRLGHRRALFDIIKFRSMRIDAEVNGPVWAAASKTDSRLTPIGAFLRATHLDEIPQILNVLRGEVSFVGPRPERPVFCQELEEKIPLFRLRTLVKPGITGWAQVRAGYANTVDDSRRKLEFDLYYILKHSPLLDLRVVVETVGVLFSGGSEGRKRERAVRSVVPVSGLRRASSTPLAPLGTETITQARDVTEISHAEIS